MIEFLRVLSARIRAFFNRTQLDHDFDDELANHLDLATADNVRRGMSAIEARRDAVLRFGSPVAAKELHRDTRGLPWLDVVLQDLRYTLRAARREPGFYVASVLILGLGIGATTAIFSIVDGVLLRPTPVVAIDRVAMVWETDRRTGTTREPASVPDFLDFQARTRTFERLGAITAGEVNLAPPTGDPVRLAVLRATHDFMPILGIRPRVGRAFGASDDVAGSNVVMISESLWERSFGRDPAVIGQRLQVDDSPVTVIGVMPDEAGFGVLQILTSAAYARSFADRGVRTQVDLWTPFPPDPKALPRETHPIFVLGRLADGATTSGAQQELAAIAADLERTYPDTNDSRGAFVEPLGEVVFGRVRPALYVLLGTVALVLIIACVNVANLLLARGMGRAREVALRTALGGGRSRLARQFLVEGLVLAGASAVAGVAFASVALRGLVALAPADIPRVASVTIDARVLGLCLIVAVAVGLLFSMVPMLQARGVDLQAALKGERGGPTSAGSSRNRLRSALVAAELALAVVLVVGASLLVRSFYRLQRVDAGFQSAGVLKAEYQLPPARYPVDFKLWPNLKEMHQFTSRLLARASQVPGVDSVAIAGNHPLDPGFTNSFVIVGREAEAKNWPEISLRRVTPGYFRTVGLRLERGRLLADSDATEAPAVAVINQAAAHQFFPNRDPLGAQLRFWGTSRTIVGIVGNERFQGLAETAPIAAYTPLAQTPSGNGAGVLLIRTAGDPAALSSSIRGLIRELDPGLAVFGVEALDETMMRSLSERRFTMVLLGSFAVLALVLAAIGVHGVLSFGVARRTREIGLRMALGAQPSCVLRLIVQEGLVLTLIGLTVGLAAALAATRLMATLLYGVTATDPATFVEVALFLVCVALVASYLPARRATLVDPATALRAE